MTQITQVLESHRKVILGQLSLDTSDSALSQINTLLMQQTYQIREALTSIKTQRETEARTPAGGVSFEQQVGELLKEIATFAGDRWESVGDKTGAIFGSKVGDFIITLGRNRHASQEKIVVEAKHNASYTRAKALEECEVACKNREAQVSIFVWDKSRAEAKKQQSIEIQGRNIIILWDADDPTTDVYLRTAYWMACWLVIPQILTDPAVKVHQEQILNTFKDITMQSARLEDIRKAADTINKQAIIILTTTDQVKPQLEESVEFLRRQVVELLNVE